MNQPQSLQHRDTDADLTVAPNRVTAGRADAAAAVATALSELPRS